MLDFSCCVCGVICDGCPEPPAWPICPDCCVDHEYSHDPGRRGKFCDHCDKEQEYDWCDF